MAERTKHLLLNAGFWSLLLGIFAGVITTTFRLGAYHNRVENLIEAHTRVENEVKSQRQELQDLKNDVTRVKAKLGITAKQADPLAVAAE